MSFFGVENNEIIVHVLTLFYLIELCKFVCLIVWTSHGTHVYSSQMPLSALRKTALREIKQK